MKKSILIGKCAIALLFAALIFQTGCKEEGYKKEGEIVQTTTGMTTYEYLKSKPGMYDSLLFLIDNFGMKNVLDTGKVTLFAPSNTNFQIAIKALNDARRLVGKPAVYLKDLAHGKVGLEKRLRLKAEADSAHLDTMVSRYIIQGLYLAEDFAIGDGLNITSVRSKFPMHGRRVNADAQGFKSGGSEVIQFSNTKRLQIEDKWSKVLTTSVNIKTKNGIVHLIRPDHIFGHDEFVLRSTVIPPPPNLFNYKEDEFYPVFQRPTDVDGTINPGERLAKALDGNILTKWITYFNLNDRRVTIYWVPKTPQICNAYSFTSANDSKIYQFRDPRAWRVQATTDDPKNAAAVWTTIDTRQDQEFTTNYQRKIYDFNNATAYRGYRIEILQCWTIGADMLQFSEWTMNYREPQ